MNTEQIAKICHEANKAYCESLGDFSQKPWEQTTKELQNSALDGVQFKLSTSPVSPADSHANWLKFKTEQGYKYGPIKDNDKKEHPCMVPYEQLPKEQRLKDYIFTAIVEAFIKCQ